MPDTNTDGALALALAAAQSTFPTIPREKEVTVKTKQGGEYKFKYAPLEAILTAVRKPLSDNGLAITQLLDDGELVTMLMHKDGARLAGRVTLPAVDGLQALGSAITYLRRYSIVAILGIATEEDDDGNHASGNTPTFGKRPSSRAVVEAAERPYEPPVSDDGGLIGIASVGKGDADWALRQGPDGPILVFRLVQGRQGIKVVSHGPLAEALFALRQTIEGQRCICWGTIADESFDKDGKKITYQVMTLERIQTPEFTLPAENVEAPSVPLFSEGDMAALDAELVS